MRLLTGLRRFALALFRVFSAIFAEAAWSTSSDNWSALHGLIRSLCVCDEVMPPKTNRAPDAAALALANPTATWG